MKDILENYNFYQVDSNVYHLKVIQKDSKVIDLFLSDFKEIIRIDSEIFNYDGLTLNIKENILEIKAKDNDSNLQDLDVLENIVLFFKNDQIVNIFDFFIFKNKETTYEKFFSFFDENSLKYSILKPYISKLKNMGLIFDLDKIHQSNDDEDYIAIDCLDYIKFIPYSEFDETKRIDALVAEIKEYYHENEDVSQWLEINFRRHLRKNVFNSNEIYHIIDWMISLEDKSILRKNMPYPKALSKANDWVSNQNENSKLESFVDIEGEDVITLEENGSYVLVKLVSKNSKLREGVKMKNCIGKFHTNNENLYSVRYQGKRIASIDMSEDKVIKELKGPINKEVKLQYQESVLNILLKFGINPVGNHRDLHNIGCSVYKFLIDGEQKKEFIFLGPKNSENSNSIIDLFELKTESEVKSLVIQITSHLKGNQLIEITDQIQNFILNNYKTCPISQFLISKQKGAWYFNSMDHFKNTIDLHSFLRKPFYIAIKNKLTTTKDKNFSKIIESSIIDLLDGQLGLEDISHTDKVKMFLDLINLEQLKHLKAHGFFYSTKNYIKKNSIYSHINSSLGLDSFNDIIGKVKLFKKYSVFDNNTFNQNFYFSYTIPKEASTIRYQECKFCDNHNVYDKYNELVEDFNNKRSDLESYIEKAEDHFEVIEGTLIDCFDFIKKIRSLALNFIKINVDGEETENKISEVKDLILNINEIVEEYKESKMSEDCFSEIEDFEGLVNKIIDCYKDLDDIAYKINKLTATTQDCEGCSNCDKGGVEGEEDSIETCSKCNGDYSPCDTIILDEVDRPDDSEFEQYVLSLSDKEISIFNPFRIDWIIDMRKEVNNFCDNIQDSKRAFIDLLK